MAESSGFQTDLPQSAYLSLSIERAISLAKQRSHRYVTLEHLLFTLMDDPHTVEILEGLRADIAGIRGNIAEAVNRGLTSLYTPGEFNLHASYKVERVLQTASDDAERLNCEEVDAAFVIAALSRESDNMATGILKRNGIAYASAVSWLYANRGSATPSVHSRNRQSQDAKEKDLGAPPVEMPMPSPSAPRGPVAAPPARGPARVAPAQDRYATEPEPAFVQNARLTAENAHISAPVLQPYPEAEENGDTEILELELEAHDFETRREPPAYETEPQQNEPHTDDVLADTGPHNAPHPKSAPRERAANGWDGNPAGTTGGAPVPPQSKPQAATGYSEYRGIERQAPPSPPPSGFPEGDGGEPKLPVGSLEKMRLHKARPVRGEAQPPAPSKKAKASKGKRSRSGQMPVPQGRSASQNLPVKRSRRQQRPHEVFAGRLIENIPRKMRAAVAERVEVRISREETLAFLRGMEGRGEIARHDIQVTQTMSIALRAPDGGFSIESLNPETQWIFNRPEENDVYGRWRWVVTPNKTGTRKLQLLIASRSLGSNGVVADSALPDQAITIQVRTNYLLTLARSIQWIAAMVVGGILTELAMFGSRLFGL